MKKILILATALIMAGCSNLPSSFSPATMNVAVQEKISVSISSGDFYAVGYSKIDEAGTLVAEGKARKQAKENLKIKISNEVSTIFNKYMKELDENIRKVYSPVLADLKNYTTDTVLSKAVEKITFADGDKSYSALSVKKDDILKESKLVFDEYTSLIIKKLENSKSVINNSDNLFFNNSNTVSAPVADEVLEEADVNASPSRNEGVLSVEEDPLFQ